MKFLSRWLPLLRFRGSRGYWEDRYRLGGDAGAGSFGAPARYKADLLNAFVARHGIASVVEFGCGDGHQLALAHYPAYLGIDVSKHALAHCERRFAGDAGKRFLLQERYAGEDADLSLSIDVIFHLVEDAVYDDYLERVFAAGRSFVILYTTSTTERIGTLPHVRHRDVERDAAQRFPQFERLVSEEATLPVPVDCGEELPTRFLLFKRAG